MVRTIIHGARMGGGDVLMGFSIPVNGVQHTDQISIWFSGGGGGAAKWTGAAGFTATLWIFSGENPAVYINNNKVRSKNRSVGEKARRVSPPQGSKHFVKKKFPEFTLIFPWESSKIPWEIFSLYRGCWEVKRWLKHSQLLLSEEMCNIHTNKPS